MALITSHTGLEALNVEVGDMQYQHYSGRFYLYINFIVQNLARPEQICEIGDVLTGPNFAKSLQQFDFTKNSFHYTFDFNWENDSDNAGWWIRKTARRATVDVEFVFLRTFHWMTENEDEDGGGKDGKENDPLQWVVEEVMWYVKPIHTAQAHLPSLKLRISAGDPVMRNGVIGCVGSAKAKVRRVVASAPGNHVIVESRARITAERAEFDQFIEALQEEISAAEQDFFRTHPDYAPKNQSLPVPQAATTLLRDDPYYVDHGDGTVTDRRTGLQWMRFSLGQEWKDGVYLGEIRKYMKQEALEAAIELNSQGGYAGHADWRLPTIEELKTLIYCSSGQPRLWNDTGMHCLGKYERPTIYQPAFPNTLTCEYWSSTNFWCVYFNDGIVYSYMYGYVRLVRGTKTK